MRGLQLGCLRRGFGLVCLRGCFLAGIAIPSWSGEGSAKDPQERVVDLGGGVKMRSVLIPAGTFTMGSTHEEVAAIRRKWPHVQTLSLPFEVYAHKETIAKAFYMGKYEVTVGQFRKFVDATGFKTDAEKGTEYMGVKLYADAQFRDAKDASWRNPYFRQGDDHPVVCVSWNDARAFADWLNATDKGKPEGFVYRLPTEAEWEYACRAGTTTWYQWGDNPDDGKGWCNASDLTAMKNKMIPSGAVFKWDDGFLYTAPVGSFKANAFGLHDMHGNASELCQVWRAEPNQPDHKAPSRPAQGQPCAYRGGSWINPPWGVRSADRIGTDPHVRDNCGGFRLALARGAE